MEKFPHYYDFYIELFHLDLGVNGETDDTIIELGCRHAIQRLKKENNGKLPTKMNWYFIENRHIFRIIFAQAECLSEKYLFRKSNRLLNMLLRFHPSDNIGARFLRDENLEMQRDTFETGK